MSLKIEEITSKILLTTGDLKAIGIPGSNTTWLRDKALGIMPRRLRIGGRICWNREEIMAWLDEIHAARAHQSYADDPKN